MLKTDVEENRDYLDSHKKQQQHVYLAVLGGRSMVKNEKLFGEFDSVLGHQSPPLHKQVIISFWELCFLWGLNLDANM